MKTTVQNNKNSGNFCVFFIQNSGNFYEKKQLLDVFFPRNSGNNLSQQDHEYMLNQGKVFFAGFYHS